VPLDVKLEFWYPTDVSRPYLPDPKRVFQAFTSDLNKAGFQIVPKSAPWTPDYLDTVLTGKAALYLLGQTGDFGDPDTFLGTFFRTERPGFGFNNPEIFKLLTDALAETNEAARIALYQEANRKIMEFLPGLPFAHSTPALGFSKKVQGFVPSPTSLEAFAPVTIQD
jgi:peptide/nickel transport system substrate-binding protein